MEASLIALAARVAALEAKLAEVYDHLGLTEPSSADAVSSTLSPEAIALARAGRRTDAIALVQQEAGVDAADALAQVDAYLRSIGR